MWSAQHFFDKVLKITLDFRHDSLLLALNPLAPNDIRYIGKGKGSHYNRPLRPRG